MKTINICSYNVRNDNLIKDFSQTSIEHLYKNLINDYEIDVLATQEMIDTTVKILKSSLKEYHVFGKYRYGKSKLINKIKPINKYNEANNIITNLPVLTEKTMDLPWIPRTFKEFISGLFKDKSITPRIITEIIIDIESFGMVRFLNTHLSHHLKETSRRQLKKIARTVKSSTIPVVLTGDFNVDIDNKSFKHFIKELEIMGLKRVEINYKTFKKSKKDKAIDHIFIPSNWEIKKCQIIDEPYLDNYSDHYPIMASVVPNNN